MDSKRIKGLLKLANKLVLEKKFEETIEICNEILAADERNYMALTFLGAAQDGEGKYLEALKSYKLAVEVDSSQQLALQGLSKLYEKDERVIKDSAEFFLTVFERLDAFLKNDTEKRLANLIKHCRLLLSLGNLDSALEVMSAATATTKDSGLDPRRLYDILFDDRKVFSVAECRRADLLMKAARIVSEDVDSETNKRELAWATYVECRVKMGSSEVELWTLNSKDCPVPTCRYRNELLVKIYLDTYPERSEFNIEEARSQLEEGNVFGIVLDAFHFFLKGKFKDCTALLETALEKEKTLLVAHHLLAECTHELHRYKESSATAIKGLKLLEDSSSLCFYGDRRIIRSKLRFLIAKNDVQLDNESTLKEAESIISELKSREEIHPVELRCLELLTSLKLNNNQAVDEISKELLGHPEIRDGDHHHQFLVDLTVGKMNIHKKNFQKAQKCIEKALSIKDDSSEAHLLMGIVQWEMLLLNAGNSESNDGDDDDDVKRRKEEVDERKKLFLAHMNKAIQLDPANPISYYYVGLYLDRIGHSKEKAKQFLMKAYDTDTNDVERLASSLIDFLLRVNDQDSTLFYLQKISYKTKNECPKWVLLRLGAYYFKNGNISEAVGHLQAAVRKDTKDLRTWERLGEAYLERGSYTSALKAFTRVTDSDPSCIYSLYQTAFIQQKLGLLKEACEKFKVVLEMSTDYTPALFGLGETCLQLACQYVSKCLFGRSVLHVQEAINSLARACELNPSFSCSWKCLGDCFSSFYGIPGSQIRITVPDSLALMTSEDSTSSPSKLDLLVLGEKCYKMALNLCSEVSTLWHDLGLNLHYQVKVGSRTMVAGEGASVTGSTALNLLARKSFQCLQKAVSLCPTAPDHWDSLGVIAASKPISNYALAQHCFIKSIEVQSNNVTAWSNLGFLYLLNDKKQLAHEAFKKAQSIEPHFVNSWIGQAMIAEQVKDQGHTDWYDAMDLFRHSVETDNHPEAAISYAHWVCSTLDEVDNNSINNNNKKKKNKWLDFTFNHLNAVDSALDAMTRYTETRPDDLRGWNYYGLLCEKQKLYRTAVKAFERCLQLLEKSQNVESRHRCVVLGNLARLLCKTGDYTRSLEQFQELFVVLFDEFEDEISLFEICQWALSYFKAGQYDMSFETYQSALQLDMEENDPCRNLLLVAMGTTLFMKEDVDDAISLLFKDIGGGKEPTQENICSLLCLGLIRSDLALTHAAVNEIFKVGQRSIACSSIDLAFLGSRAKFLLSKSKSAYPHLKDFLRVIHLRPDQSEGWVRAAMFLLSGRVDDDIIRKVKVMCRAALEKSDKKCCQEALQCLIIVTLKESSLLSSQASSTEKNKLLTSFSLAQKLVHLYPDQLTNWCMLLAAAQQQLAARQLVAGSADVSYLEKFVVTTSKSVMDQVEKAISSDRENPYLKGMHLWLSRQYAISLIGSGRVKEAETFLQNAVWLYDDDKLLNGLNSFVGANVQQISEEIEVVGDDEEEKENLSKLLAALLVSSSQIGNKKELLEKYVKKSRWYQFNPELWVKIEDSI